MRGENINVKNSRHLQTKYTECHWSSPK